MATEEDKSVTNITNNTIRATVNKTLEGEEELFRSLTLKEKIQMGAIIIGGIIILVLLCTLLLHSITKSDPKVVNVKDTSNTTEVATALKGAKIDDADSVAKKVVKEIKYIKEHDVAPDLTEEIVSADTKDIEKQKVAMVKKDNGDVGIAEAKKGSTNGSIDLYSIHLDKEKHGLGIFGGVNSKDGSRVEYGLHYRNRRVVYQVGTSNQGGFNARVAIEAIQW